jgi:hypothetical protein
LWSALEDELRGVVITTEGDKVKWVFEKIDSSQQNLCTDTLALGGD